MTATTRTIRTLMLALVVVALPILAGCGTVQKNHDQSVNAANQRWRELRTGLMVQMAQRQFDTGDLDQAQKSLNEAINTDPTNAQLYLLAGRIQLERGQLEAAYGLFDVTLQHEPNTPEAYYYQGIIKQRWQKFDDALDRYTKAYDLRSTDPAFLLAVCETLVALDRPQDALAKLQSRADYFDQNAGIPMAMGQIHMLLGHPGEAAELLYKASLMRPQDLQLQESLATAQMAAGLHQRAASTIERLLNDGAYSKRADLQLMLAKAYLGLGRNGDAKTLYVKITRDNPDNGDNWIRLGEVCWSMQDFSGASLAANRAMAVAPRRFEGFLLAGMVAQQRGQLDEALRALDRAADLAPEATSPLILRGLALEQAGRDTAAAQSYAQALQRQPDDEKARQLLARLEARRGG